MFRRSYGLSGGVSPGRRGTSNRVMSAMIRLVASRKTPTSIGRPRPPVFLFQDRSRVSRDAQAVRAASPPPNYVILYSDSAEADTRLLEHALDVRLARATAIEPSLGDDLAHLINPRHNHATEAVVLSVIPLTATSR